MEKGSIINTDEAIADATSLPIGLSQEQETVNPSAFSTINPATNEESSQPDEHGPLDSLPISDFSNVISETTPESQEEDTPSSLNPNDTINISEPENIAASPFINEETSQEGLNHPITNEDISFSSQIEPDETTTNTY